MQINIAKDNQTVRIYSNDDQGPFYARLWVNTHNGQDGDATLVSRKFKTRQGAERWANSEPSK